LGWVVQPAAGGVVWWHDGGHPGDRSLLVHWPNGGSIAVVFNSRPRDPAFLNDVIASLNAGLAEITGWPAGDLFSQYDPPAAH